jgi:hypothetical protein
VDQTCSDRESHRACAWVGCASSALNDIGAGRELLPERSRSTSASRSSGRKSRCSRFLIVFFLGDTHGQEPRKTICSGSDLELIGVVVDDNPAERLSPPVAERARVPCVDDRLLPLEAHDSIVETGRPGCPETPEWPSVIPPGRVLASLCGRLREVWRRDPGCRDPSRPRPGSSDDVGQVPEVRCPLSENRHRCMDARSRRPDQRLSQLLTQRIRSRRRRRRLRSDVPARQHLNQGARPVSDRRRWDASTSRSTQQLPQLRHARTFPGSGGRGWCPPVAPAVSASKRRTGPCSASAARPLVNCGSTSPSTSATLSSRE